jgi:two-component system sensor histidine kinase KdpD
MVFGANSMSDPHNSVSPSTEGAAHMRLGEGLGFWLAARPTRAWVIPFFLSVLGIAVLTWLSLRMELNIPTGGFIYLIMVVLSAANGGFWSGTLTSVVAAVCLDYFFVPPIFHFDVDDPMNWVSLGAFEFTALVITLLQERVQYKAEEASAAHKGTERLFNAARGILAFEKPGELGDRITQLIKREFELSGVMLFDAPSESIFVSGDCAPKMEKGVRDASLMSLDTFDPETQTHFCAMRAGARTVGSLALSGTTMSGLMAQAIASLCAITLERARASEKETHAEAARQAEQLRSAVIEALAHQIKTPICVIQVASSSLAAMGELSPIQSELVASLDDQSMKLNDLVTRLLGAADLETAQINPQLAPVLASDLIGAAIRSVEDQAQRARFQVSVEGEEGLALADGRLMTIAFTQIVDNAVKYSVPKTPIVVTVATDPERIHVRVQNRGGVIAPADRERIFERFYRTAEARQGPVGTGLGLSIAKRIVEAHQGSIGVESEAAEGTVFEIVLPRVRTN